jgi:hypothetical protein
MHSSYLSDRASCIDAVLSKEMKERVKQRKKERDKRLRASVALD